MHLFAQRITQECAVMPASLCTFLLLFLLIPLIPLQPFCFGVKSQTRRSESSRQLQVSPSVSCLN